MIAPFAYALKEERVDVRFADTVLAVAAPQPELSFMVRIAPVRFDSGVFFTLKCNLEAYGKFLLKRFCEYCISVSNLVRRVDNAIRFNITAAMEHLRHRATATKTFLSFCVFRR